MILITLLATALQVSLPFPIATNAIPDFSGTWKIDRKLTTWEYLSELEDLTFVISQTDTTVTVKRLITRKKHKTKVKELSYYPDGRGEKISVIFSDQKWDSKTVWVGQAMVSKFTVTSYESLTSDFYYHDYVETWSMSADRKVLTVSTEITVRNVPSFLRSIITSNSYRKVFRRSE